MRNFSIIVCLLASLFLMGCEGASEESPIYTGSIVTSDAVIDSVTFIGLSMRGMGMGSGNFLSQYFIHVNGMTIAIDDYIDVIIVDESIDLGADETYFLITRFDELLVLNHFQPSAREFLVKDLIGRCANVTSYVRGETFYASYDQDWEVPLYFKGRFDNSTGREINRFVEILRELMERGYTVEFTQTEMLISLPKSITAATS